MESKAESMAFELPAQKQDGFLPMKKTSFEPLIKSQNLIQINKENSFNFLANNFSSVLSIQNLPLKEEV